MVKINVFYADDDEDDMMFFNEAVEKVTSDSENQVSLHLHVNGEHLIENIKKNKDGNRIVFLDINMPLKTGMELLEEIRKEPEIQKVPVIMYSTSSNPTNIDECRNLGADLYVIKPSRFSDLEKMIANFLQFNWKNHHVDPKNFLYKG